MGSGRRDSATALLLLLSLSVAFAGKHDVGGRGRWAPGVNYTQWAAGERLFLGDWLVFYYQKGYYDVIEVNSTNYERCSEENPILKYSKGRSFAMQLNETRRYYFISGGGYCWNGMRLAILVEPLPAAPAPAPLPVVSGAGGRSAVLAGVVAVAALVCGL